MAERPLPEILALGEPMVEFNQAGDPSGRLYRQGFGGDVSNFAIAAARQGARVGLVSAVGDDPYGRRLRGLWADEGIDDRFVATDPDAYTAVYFVSHDAQGHHFHFFRQGSAAARMGPPQLPLAAIQGCRLLHLSGISLGISTTACDAGLAAIAAAREAGVAVSFDTNLRRKLWPLARARAVITEAMRGADLCLPSLDDVTALTGLTDPDAIVDHCLRLGARVVALKLGADGALVADATRRHRIAPHSCQAVDATGAGDTFGGAFATRWLAGDDLPTAGRYAAVAAALSTEGYGAVEPIPRAEAVRRALAAATPDAGEPGQ
ncbi:MAG: sugar kinase [Burkholderiaceae bacterium]|nr:sugar kinase [Burkholderiaceae bacterium]